MNNQRLYLIISLILNLFALVLFVDAFNKEPEADYSDEQFELFDIDYDYIPKSTKCYVNYATDLAYMKQSIHNFYYLRNIFSNFEFKYIVYYNNFTPSQDILTNPLFDFIEFKNVPNIIKNIKNTYYKLSMNKLHIFNEYDCDKIVYFDSDSVILNNNIDQYIDTASYDRVAMPLSYWDNCDSLSSALIILEPNNKMYDDLVNRIDNMNKPDMDLLNLYFSERIGDCFKYYKNALQLPYNTICITDGSDLRTDHFKNEHNDFEYDKMYCEGSFLLHFSLY